MTPVTTPKTPAALAAPEVEINGEAWVTMDKAAEILQVSYIKAVNLGNLYNLPCRYHPATRRRMVVRRADVEALKAGTLAEMKA